jgi:hypothetical protein
LATARRIQVWCLAWLADQTAAAIADDASQVVRELTAKGFDVSAVVTDNASNWKAALNSEVTVSVQSNTNLCLFPIPCLSHTADFSIGDAICECFPDSNVRRLAACINW